MNAEQEEVRLRAEQEEGRLRAAAAAEQTVGAGEGKATEQGNGEKKEVVLYKTPLNPSQTQNQTQNQNQGQRPKSKKGVRGPILL